MFKVECPGCKAPYQVDERRVPPTGLKMRCPKCGSSFHVEPPPADSRGPAPGPVTAQAPAEAPAQQPAEALPARPPLPKKKPQLKGTMIGVAPPLKGGPPKPPSPSLAPRPAPVEPEPAPPPAASADPFADLDLPAVVAPAASAPPVPARGQPTLPQPGAARGIPRPRGAEPPPRPAADPFGEMDLPAAAPAARGGRTLAGHADLPDAAQPARAPMPSFGNEIDFGDVAGLPAPAAPRAAPEADPFADLAAAAGSFGSGPPAGVSAGAFDLPSPVAGFGAELPSPGRGGGFGAELPSPGRGGGFGADLPSPAGGFGAELPSPARGGGFGADLPSPIAGFGELDLPVVGAAGLPAVGGVGLPAPAQSVGLPVVAVDDPFGAPQQAAGGGAVPGGFGSAAADADPFGGAAAADPFGGTAGGAPDPFGAPPGGAMDPFGASAGPDPFAAPGGGGADPFAAPGGGADPFAAPAGADPFAAPPGGPPDPFGARGGGTLGGPPARSVPPRGEAFDDASPVSEEFAPPQAPDDDRKVKRQQGGGGTDYGEVSLDDGGDGVSIEGDGPARRDSEHRIAAGAAVGDGPSAPGALAQARAVAYEASAAVLEIQAARRRRRLRGAVVSAVTVLVAGGALSFLPDVGPFGAYFLVDQVRRGEYEQTLQGVADETHQKLGQDTYLAAGEAVESAIASVGRAPRYKPLAAYAAFVGFAKTIRFGAEANVYARAKVALTELAATADSNELALARAAESAADGEIAGARAALASLAEARPADVDVAVLRAEVELRARDGAAAVAAWTTARNLEKTARTAFGLARSFTLAGKGAEAKKLAEEALASVAAHSGARLLLAEAAWRTTRDEVTATRLLDEVLKAGTAAGPEARIDAHTLFGEIHLNRGRVTQAEAAFGDAIRMAEEIKVSAKGARALAGFGETLFRAGRYSQAIARFKGAATADPDDVVAQVGVAKCSLELERLDEAKEMLTKLRRSHAKQMHVAYWYGRVLDALGDRKEAEVAFKDAIEAGKDDAESVHSYIALAGVYSQNGQLEQATAALADAQKRLPASPALHKALGRLAMKQGRYADALTAFRQARELDGEDVDARFLVGTAHTRLGEFDKAIEVYDAVAKIDRDFPGLALERGILFQESGRGEEALREYEAALNKAPNDPDLMLKVGCGKADAGNGAEAEKLLRKVLEQRQTSAETHYCLGRALFTKRELNESIKAFERAVQVDPNRAEYHYWLGRACVEAGFIPKASTSLKRALELDQGLADAYWQRGVLRVKQSRPRDAIEDLSKALALRPTRFEAHADLALANYDLGREDEALVHWQRAIAANPTEASWRFHYGKLLGIRLQHAESVVQLKKAIELATAPSPTPRSYPWLAEGNRLCAISVGNSPEAIPYWQAFLRGGAANSPFRKEALAALRRLGKPWEDD